jgi:hypothetical protein
MFLAWSHTESRSGQAVIVYTGPIWYSLITVGLLLGAAIAALTADYSGFGWSKRRYLRRLSSARAFTWRRYFVINPIDVTNQVGIGLVVGLPAGALLAILIARWLGS